MILLNKIFAEFNTNQFEVKVPSSEISFSLIDSIHSLYSRASMSLNDKNGLYSEYLLSTIGNVLNIKFGNTDFKKDVLTSNLILSQEMMEKSDQSPDKLAGTLDLSFVHEWYNKQEISSKSYEDTVSSIVASIVKKYPFAKTKIDNVASYDTFFQALRTEGEMIEQDFIPISYSSEASNTPFFAFINSKNEFNYVSYNTLFSNNLDKVDDEYALIRSDTTGSTKVILDISRWSLTLKNLKKFNRNYYILDSDSKINKDYSETRNYFSKPFKFSYPLANDPQLATNYNFRYYGDSDDNHDNHKGQMAFDQRDSLFKDRFMILVPFNPKLVAGNTLNLDLTIPNEVNKTYSERFSGKYLIEISEHTWDGQSAVAASKFIVSRKYSNIPSSYTLRKLLK